MFEKVKWMLNEYLNDWENVNESWMLSYHRLIEIPFKQTLSDGRKTNQVQVFEMTGSIYSVVV